MQTLLGSKRGVLTAVMLAGLFLTFASVSHRALAFRLIGPYWQHDENGGGCGPAAYNPPITSWNACVINVYLSNLTVSGWPQSANQAASKWNLYDSTYGRQDFSYDTLVPPVGQRQVSLYQSDLGGPDKNGITELGTTSWRYSGTEMTSGIIQINTDSTISWCTVNDSGCPSSTQFPVEETMSHELGHALGLNHPVYHDGLTVMQCNHDPGELTLLGADDVSGESYLYSGHASDFGSPGSDPGC